MTKYIKKIDHYTMISYAYPVMGTVFTSQIVLNSENIDENLFKVIETSQHNLENYLEKVDFKFSTFNEDSEVNQYSRGELTILDVSEDLLFVISSCFAAKIATDSAFDANGNEQFDPSGFVKGWAVEEGQRNYLTPLFRYNEIEAVNLIGGGDMQMTTKQESNWEFKVGVVNPNDTNKIIKMIKLKTGAMATSGISERGNHIIGANKDILQVTVIGQSLQEVDVWATALMVKPNLKTPDHLDHYIIYKKE